jgi:hypothetical protein
VLAELTTRGAHAAARGWTINSGHADGADYAFEVGARQNCVVYLPWDGFNSKLPILGVARVVQRTDELDDLVRRFHPSPGKLTDGGWAMMRRNAYQVLGHDLNDPVDAVVCWTRDGAVTGGTGHAIRIAAHRGIPVINMFEDGSRTASEVVLALEKPV